MARRKSSRFLHHRHWQMDSLALGQFFLPTIEKMAVRIPQLRCAVLCTPDGFNICSLGLTENQVGKMAALSSSLLSVGDATVSSLAASGLWQGRPWNWRASETRFCSASTSLVKALVPCVP